MFIIYAELERLAGNYAHVVDDDLITWCHAVHFENDLLFDVYSMQLHNLKEDYAAQISYMKNNIQILSDIIGLLPDAIPEFNKRFLSDNIEILIEYLESEMRLVPFKEAGVRTLNFKKTIGISAYNPN